MGSNQAQWADCRQSSFQLTNYEEWLALVAERNNDADATRANNADSSTNNTEPAANTAVKQAKICTGN